MSIVRVLADGRPAKLSTDHALSRYGQPVLVIGKSVFGPGEFAGDVEPLDDDTDDLTGRWRTACQPRGKQRNAPAMTGAEFRAMRERMGLTQEQLAALLGKTSSAVSRWERAEHIIDTLVLRAMRDVERELNGQS